MKSFNSPVLPTSGFECQRVSSSYLVKEILDQMSNANVVEMTMCQQKFLEVLDFRDGIITVPHCLPTLFALDT